MYGAMNYYEIIVFKSITDDLLQLETREFEAIFRAQNLNNKSYNDASFQMSRKYISSL